MGVHSEGIPTRKLRTSITAVTETLGLEINEALTPFLYVAPRISLSIDFDYLLDVNVPAFPVK